MLKEVMLKELDKYVKHYKTDVKYDFEKMLDKENFCNKEEIEKRNDWAKWTNERFFLVRPTKKYYWLLRENGTYLLDKENVLFSQSDERTIFDYYYDNNEIVALYEVEVKNIVGDTIEGSIKKIGIEKTYEKILKGTKNISFIVTKIVIRDFEPIYFKSGDTNTRMKDLYHMLDRNNIKKENVVRVYSYYF